VPPVVTVAVATSVVPAKRSKELAEATGTITNAAPMTNARIERLRLVIRTLSPFLTSNAPRSARRTPIAVEKRI
jgi:hypothetical protein